MRNLDFHIQAVENGWIVLIVIMSSNFYFQIRSSISVWWMAARMARMKAEEIMRKSLSLCKWETLELESGGNIDVWESEWHFRVEVNKKGRLKGITQVWGQSNWVCDGSGYWDSHKRKEMFQEEFSIIFFSNFLQWLCSSHTTSHRLVSVSVLIHQDCHFYFQ